VYSTCSLSPLQNEEIVQHLLETDATAVLEPINTSGSSSINGSKRYSGGPRIPWRSGSIPGTVIFHPDDGISGLFIAKIRKRKRPR